MINGYEQFLPNPFFSVIISILLFFGSSFFGYLLLNFTFIKKFKNSESFFLLSPFIFLNFSIFIFWPLINLNLINKFFFSFYSYIILFGGVFSIFYFYNKLSTFNQFIKNLDFKIKLTLLLFFLLCLTPVTDADSLAYHLKVAEQILLNGSFEKNLLPFETKQGGAGEILIALGLASGSEHYGKLVQFSSILAILAIFFNINSKKIVKKNQTLIFLCIVSSPLVLFFLSSSKPQLMMCVNALLVFSILYQKFDNSKNLLSFMEILFLISLLIINFVSKFSFILSSSLLGFMFLVYSFKNKILIKFFSASILASILLVLPSFYFKYLNFNLNIYQFFQSPLPINFFVYEVWDTILKNSGSSPKYFPYWLIIPSGDFKDFSTVIGPTILLFIFFKNTKKFLNIFLILFLFIFLMIFFGQASPRFVFESYLIIVYLMLTLDIKKNLRKLFNYFVISQWTVIIIITSYFIFILFPFTFSKEERRKIMIENANGYELIEWVNSKIDKDDIVISHHRSKSLLNATGYETFVLNRLDFDLDKNFVIKNIIKKNKVDKLIYFDQSGEIFYERCILEVLHFKKNAGRKVGRNPFRKKKKYYDAWIYKFDYKNFPKC